MDVMIGETKNRRLEAFEKLCSRRMLEIKWIDKITNEEKSSDENGHFKT